MTSCNDTEGARWDARDSVRQVRTRLSFIQVNFMRNSFLSLLSGGLFLVASGALAGNVSAATIGSTTTCSNGVANTGGLGLICQVTIVNTINGTGGSARVTVRECH